MPKVSRNSGNSNRNLKHNEVGAGAKPRLKGNSSTTNVGKGSGKSGGRNDLTDQSRFKRGDGKGPKGDNYMTDSSKAHRSSNANSKANADMTHPIQKPLARGSE